MLARLEASVASQQETVAELQTAVTETEATLEAKQAEWNTLHEKLVEKNMGLQAVIKEQKMQLEGSETELNHILNQTNAQGDHLAEIQTRLVERELQLKQAIAQLKQARAMIEKQNQAIKQIQQKAGERIRVLQTQLGNN
jgi:uncharacterized coiled-coil protein SlyX